VGLRARDFPTERVLSRTPLIIRTVDQKIEAASNRERERSVPWISLGFPCLKLLEETETEKAWLVLFCSCSQDKAADFIGVWRECMRCTV
jgi:hypothetical protein